MKGVIKSIPFELQHKIVCLLAWGYSVKQMPDVLGLTFSVCEAYILSIRREYGAKNTAHLVHIWHNRRMLKMRQAFKTKIL